MAKRLATVLVLFFACDLGGETMRQDPVLLEKVSAFTKRRLETFATAADFDAYTDALSKASRRGGGGLYGCAGSYSKAAADVPAQDEGPAGMTADESITNNQEASVDEGGIVKASGDFFIVLRRGRLFSLRHTDALSHVSTIDAFPPGSHLGTWYDEMLVDRDRVVVIGFSYEVNATEIGFFQLAEDGTLSHQATHFLSSNDYYSSRNYASRLKDGKLLLYMPDGLMRWGNGVQEYAEPTLGRWNGTGVQQGAAIVAKTDVYQPIATTMYPIMHKIVQCDLRTEETACSARVVVGDWARVSYVSATAAYLWVTESSATSTLYRLPLDAAEPVTAARTYGMPIDQFSFDEGDGVLNVLVQANGQGEAMFGAENKNAPLALLQLPLSSFSAEPGEPDVSRYTALPSSAVGYNFHNRFVGAHLLYGNGSDYWYDEGDLRETTLYVVALGERPQLKTLPLDHGVDRLEALGNNAAFVAGNRERSLLMTTVALGEMPAIKATIITDATTQGESRSHGFFFKPGEEGGLAALPVRHSGGDYASLLNGSAEVSFMRVDGELGLEPIGGLSASREVKQNDNCSVSCVDWYGNARPIFFRGRIFALLGYELVEGALTSEAIVEQRRLDFTP